MLIHIITPAPAYIFFMMQSYNEIIFALNQNMCI